VPTKSTAISSKSNQPAVVMTVFTGFIQIAITVLANLMDCNSNKGEYTKRFFSIEEVHAWYTIFL